MSYSLYLTDRQGVTEEMRLMEFALGESSNNKKSQIIPNQ